jgi:hypothetical protein
MRVLIAGDLLAAGMLGEMFGQNTGRPAPDARPAARG